MEGRGTPKTMLLVPSTMNPEIYSQADAYCRNLARVQKVAYEPETGLMDLADLEEKLRTGQVAAVFYENPSYLGFFETRGQEIAESGPPVRSPLYRPAGSGGSGIMESPMNQGADIVCGDIQPLGMHIQFGGGQAGFIACQQDVELIRLFPTYMYGIAETGGGRKIRLGPGYELPVFPWKPGECQ